jgi:hypothetical protein
MGMAFSGVRICPECIFRELRIDRRRVCLVFTACPAIGTARGGPPKAQGGRGAYSASGMRLFEL